MANTIMTAKNTFAGGLLMDFAPDNTQPNHLTSALNATFLTFNGNEMSLLNDMGNGRVETARLPDGYIPVGSCEFGDIIYIVSYNPILNKSLIGCFPSPERNISSDEIGNANLTIKAEDFQKFNTKGNPTGELVNNSKKYIIYNKSLNPGDRYVIYTTNDALKENSETISDLGGNYDTFPRLLKLHVVSVDDSGKITYLDDSVKWYDKLDLKYFILGCIENNNVKTADIDSYRSLVSSAYSIFKSKVSGKLAILAELESITGFSCTYRVSNIETTTDDDQQTKTTYNIVMECNWDTDDVNINPSYIVLTKSELESSLQKDISVPTAFDLVNYWNASITNYCETIDGTITAWYNPLYKTDITYLKIVDLLDLSEYNRILHSHETLDKYLLVTNAGITWSNENGYTIPKTGEPIPELVLPDTVVNNKFHLGVYKQFASFTLPKALNAKYHYEITPAMDYGLLKQYAVSGYIDFSKINTGTIELTKWKYYITDNNVALTLGLNVYPEDNKGVSEVVLEFYDNLGFAAAYHITGRSSYSGTLKENIPLNGSRSSYKLNATDALDIVHTHFGEETVDNTGITVDDRLKEENIDEDKKTTRANEICEAYGLNRCKKYLNDAGTLYSGVVYGVKIVVKYESTNGLGEYTPQGDYSETTFKRWMWTNTVFNDYYYDELDFDNLYPQLTISADTCFTPADNYAHNSFIYAPDQFTGANEVSANVLTINGIVNMHIIPKLVDNYGSFVLNTDIKDATLVNVYKLSTEITNPENVASKWLNDVEGTENQVTLLPINENKDNLGYSKTLNDLLACDYTKYALNTTTPSNTEELWLNYQCYANTGKIEFSSDAIKSGSITYLKGDDEHTEPNCPYVTGKLTVKAEDNGIPLSVNLIHFSKYIQTGNINEKLIHTIKPLILTEDDLNQYGFLYNGGHIYIEKAIGFGGRRHRESAGGRYKMKYDLDELNEDKLLIPSNIKEYDAFDRASCMISVYNNNYDVKNDSLCRYYSITTIPNDVGNSYSAINNFTLLHINNAPESDPTNIFKGYDITTASTFTENTKKQFTINNLTPPENSNIQGYTGLKGDYEYVFLGLKADEYDQCHLLNTGFLVPTDKTNDIAGYSQKIKLCQKLYDHEYYDGDNRDYYEVMYVVVGNNNLNATAGSYILAKKHAKPSEVNGSGATYLQINVANTFDRWNNYQLGIFSVPKGNKVYLEVNGDRLQLSLPLTYDYTTIWKPSNGAVSSITVFDEVVWHQKWELQNSTREVPNVILTVLLAEASTESKEDEISGGGSYSSTPTLYYTDPYNIQVGVNTVYPTQSVYYYFDTYIGDLICSLLTELYVVGEDITVSAVVPDNVCYLEDNSTLYSANFVYNILASMENDEFFINNYIQLGTNISYATYINQLNQKFTISNNNGALLSSDNNVNIKAQCVVLPISLLIDIPYTLPSYVFNNDSNNVRVYNNTGGYLDIYEPELNANRLYTVTDYIPKLLANDLTYLYAREYEDRSGYIIKVPKEGYANANCEDVDDIQDDAGNIKDGIYKYSFGSTTSDPHKILGYANNNLMLKHSTLSKNSSRSYFGVALKSDASGITGYLGFCDGRLDEVLLPDFQILDK